IDYIVDDCVKAGIKEIIFVINEHNYQTLHYYRENQRLHDYLQKMNKLELYDQVSHLHQKATFHFVKQSDTDTYGTATPILLAKQYIKNEEAFLYLTGDDFVYSADENYSFTRKMIDLFEQNQARGLITCYSRPKNEIHRYGVAAIEEKNGVNYLTKLVEKPKTENAPSNLANISKYILSAKIIDIIEQQQPNPDSGELYITDSITQLAQNADVLVMETKEKYLDGGNLASWLKANLVVAQNDPKLRQVIKNFAKSL
ncbi:MAG: sugar phosphate nucleotidyltransferase, partial [Patescibacteria group bacterium]|nr:sugar phosphate nucleotidyltransferase [Patescibacteria group bacterium]